MTTAPTTARMAIVVYWRRMKATAPSKIVPATSCMACVPTSRRRTSRARYSANSTATMPAMGMIRLMALPTVLGHPPRDACRSGQTDRMCAGDAVPVRHRAMRRARTACADMERAPDGPGAALCRKPRECSKRGSAGSNARRRVPATVVRVAGWGTMDRAYTRGPVMRRYLGFFVEVIETLLLTVVVYLLVQAFVAQPFRIEQGSMETTLHPGQYVLIDKLTPHFDTYSRGDIIVFRPQPEAADPSGDPVHQAGHRRTRRRGGHPRRTGLDRRRAAP